jgi:nucleotide-binding universal stress UspA family protein
MLNYRKKILVAVDGSAVSDKAVYEAVWMAGCTKGAFPNKVYAVFSKVVRSDDFSDMFPMSPSSAAGEDDRRWEEIIDLVFLVARKLARENGVELEIRVVSGPPAESIIKLAKEIDADTIVIGNTGKGRVVRSLLGSVSAEVMNKAPCSVYLVRA